MVRSLFLYQSQILTTGLQKVEIDSFSGYRIYPSKGKLFVRGDSKVGTLRTSFENEPLNNDVSRFSASRPRRMPLSSCSARTPVKSPGLKFIVACTRRELQKRLLRNVRAEQSNTSAVSLVSTLPPLPQKGTRPLPRDKNNDWQRFQRPSRRKRRRNPRKPRYVITPITHFNPFPIHFHSLQHGL